MELQLGITTVELQKWNYQLPTIVNTQWFPLVPIKNITAFYERGLQPNNEHL